MDRSNVEVEVCAVRTSIDCATTGADGAAVPVQKCKENFFFKKREH